MASMYAEPIPENSERYGALIIARIDGPRRPIVKAWRGKQSRPFAHYSFQDSERRERWIAALKESEDARQQYRATTKNKRAEELSAMMARLVPGTIVYASWGYDQTNIDYWQIVRRKGRTAWVRKIASWTVCESRGSDTVAPDVGNFIGPESRHIIQPHGLTIGGHSAWPTEPGSTRNQTASGWGH